jgi:hypothetical protein
MDSAFLKGEFFALIATSLLIPVVMFRYLVTRAQIRQAAVLWYAVLLLLLGGADVMLLRRLAIIAHRTPTLFDDAVFASEISVGLYLLPVVAVGIAVNLISHILIDHLKRVETERL